MRAFLSSFALVAISILVACLLGEACLRLFMKDQILMYPRYHTSATYGDFTLRRYRPDATFWHTSVDGAWRYDINAQGFRSTKDFSYDKPNGVFRVLSLGDSQTAGAEVHQNETFSEVIATNLNHSGINAEVINAGVSGFSTAEQLVLLEQEGVRYRPDVVVVGFYANDLSDNTKAGIFRLEDDELVVVKKSHIPGVAIMDAINQFAVLRWLSENSYLYSFGFNSLWQLAKAALLSKERAKLTTEYAVATGEVDNYEVALGHALFERLYAFTKQQGIFLIIVDIPSVSRDGGIRPSAAADIRQTLQDNSDAFIDSTILFASDQVAPDQVHVAHGHRHISARAHRMIGDEVTRILVEDQAMTHVASDGEAATTP